MNELDAVDILLAEDSPEDAEMTLRTLRRRRIANRVEWVRDGAEALDFLFAEGRYQGRGGGRPKLVLLDLKMPRVDGLEALARIKADGRTRTIPVVMLTSSREEADLVASYRHGANSFIVKPVDFADFAKVIAEVGLYWIVANQIPAAGAGGG